MSIVLITGDHPRHTYLVERLAATCLVIGWVREVREAFVPEPPAGLGPSLRQLFVKHFDLRDATENDVFGGAKHPDVETLEVTRETLNGAETVAFLKRLRPRLVISYGCHILTNDLMSAADTRFWNSHGGLSPDYRGVITHFWPSYFLEPQMTGMTLHETTPKVDAGGVVHQTGAPMVAGDSLHRLAARAVADYAESLATRLPGLDFDALPAGVPQKHGGKQFFSRDWRPEHLRLIYDVYGDKVVDAVLAGEIVGREPKLISVLQ